MGVERQDGYAGLSCGDKEIVYRPSKRMINATHLAKLGEVSQYKLLNFFAKNPQINKEIRRGYAQISGTYISFDDAQVLCALFNIFYPSVQSLLTAKSVSVSPKSISIGEVDDCVGELFGNCANDGYNDPLYGLDCLGDDSQAVAEPQSREPDQLLAKSQSSHDSRFTEPSYKDGSYLAPKNRSFLQLLK